MSTPFRRSTARLVLVLLCAYLGLFGTAQARTIVVTSAADPGDGVCDATCTLREAITAANATVVHDTINFAIPTPVKTEILIALASSLPTITQPLFINGYSATFTSANTLPTGSNAKLRIRIDGGGIGAGLFGLAVCANAVTFRGLSVTGFSQAIRYGSNAAGAACGTAVTGGTVAGNFIGLRTDGVTAGANADGIGAFGAQIVVGGANLADRNVVSANGVGVTLLNATSGGGAVVNNLIGTDKSGALDRGNSESGVSIASVPNLQIGTDAGPNTIAHNKRGISHNGGSGSINIGNTWYANRIFHNDLLGIDILSNGVNPSDPNDIDDGPNGLQNFPDITAAGRIPGGVSVSGSLNIGETAPTIYRIALYANSGCDSVDGNGEGERFLGVTEKSLTSPNSETFSIDQLTADPLPPGTVITATATSPGGSSSEFSECFALDPPPLKVNSTADTDDGACNLAHCTLREAINGANVRPGPDVVSFEIAGTGVKTISPTTALPTITETVAIEGYSQPGASPNTLAVGDNAAIAIRIDGGVVVAGSAGLSICASNSVIRGLSITRFPLQGIRIGNTAPGPACITQTTGVIVAGNFIGLNPDGTAGGNFDVGVQVRSGPDTLIGGSTPADRNVISANAGGGVSFLVTSAGRRLSNNYIGTDPGGTADRGNGGFGGVSIAATADDIDVGTAAPNRVAFNVKGIVLAPGAGVRNTLFANEFLSNDNLGIDLEAPGVTANDADDADAGGNNVQNFPVLDLAQRSAGGIRIDGYLDVPVGTSNAAYTIAVYASATCDGSAHGEGERYLGTQAVNLTNGAATEGFSFDLVTSDALPNPTQITATATDANGNTSEFSACIAATSPTVDLVVTSVSDTDDGTCNLAHCTLREAINAANLQPGADEISFAIPAGPFKISPGSALPTITETLAIDGYTQLGASDNSLSEGDDAVILIQLDGVGAVANSAGLAICASNSVVRGLSITRFPLQGIRIGSTAAGPACITADTGVTVAGNFIGLNPDGSPGGNGDVGVQVRGNPDIVVGGTAPADRNVISANVLGGVRFLSSAAGRRLENNYIGTDPGGTVARGNGGVGGVSIAGSANGIAVGTAAPNRVAFNSRGILIDSSAGTGNTVFANDIFANEDLGIDLGAGGGVTANDADDADAGPNNLQNFPVLTGLGAGTELRVNGTLDVPAATSNAPYRIALYESVGCDSAGGNGEGAIYLGSQIASLSGGAEAFGVTLPIAPPAPGRVITATATDPGGNTSEFSACLGVGPPSPLFVVTSTADTDGTTCGATCTLRQAINAANLQAGADSITFAILGGGPFTITPINVLPTITESVTIDGYTQTGALPGTANVGSNAVIKIRLDGVNGVESGLRVCANDVTIRGLSVTRFFGSGILASGSGGGCSLNATGVRILGNFLGLAVDGNTAAGNGVALSINGQVVQVGGNQAQDRNLISASTTSGIQIAGAAANGTVVRNNAFGTDAAGTGQRGNGLAGVLLEAGASGVQIGDEAFPNLFRHNGRGVLVRAGATGDRLYANHYAGNTAVAIDLSATSNGDGVTANDANDGDAGANNLQNFPLLDARSQTAGSLTVQGTLDVPVATSNVSYRIALYSSPACDSAGGNGEGARFVGSQLVTLSGGAESFNVTLNGAPPAAGEVVTATATDPAGNTSEFSACLAESVVVPGAAIFANSFE